MKRYKRASDIKVGVVGYGGAFNMGRAHLQGDAEGGHDADGGGGDRPQRAGGRPAGFSGHRDVLLADGDAREVGRRTWSRSSRRTTRMPPLALQALKAGRHVVCEKPMAHHDRRVRRDDRGGRKSGVVLSTYHNRHWDGLHPARRPADPRRASSATSCASRRTWAATSKPGDWWRTSKTISGGILYDWGVHLLEYGLQIIRSDIVEVTGYAKRGYWAPQTKWKNDCNEDEAFASVRFKSGQWLTLLISTLDSNPRRGLLEITGTKGSYIVDWHFNECLQHANGKTTIEKFGNPPGEGWRYYQNLADHLTKGTRLVITPEWARRPIHILELADRSARTGKALRARYK